MPPTQEQQKSVPVLGNNVSTPPVMLQSPLPVWKRVFAFLGYIAVYYFVAKTVVALLEIGTTVTVYFQGLDASYPSWIFTAEKIGAAILGILAAWIVGRYFHWTVFRKIPREKKPHGWFVRSAFYGTSGIIILLFILLTTPSVLGLFFKDIAPIDDSDLSLPTISLPDSQNAYPDLMAASKVLDTSSDTQQLRDIVNGGTWDAQFATQAIASNTPALALFASTTQKSAFQDPIFAQPDTLSLSTIYPSLSGLRLLFRLNSLRALNLAHTGKSSEGLQTALIGVSAAQKIEASQAFILEWLTAVSMKDQSLQTIQNIIASTTVSVADLKSLAATLQPFNNDASGLVKADKLNYYEQKSTIEYLVHGDTSDTGATGGLLTVSSQIDRTNFYFHPNQSIAFLAGDIRLRITDAQQPCNTLQDDTPAKVAPSNLWLLYITPNAIGKVIHDITAVSLGTTKVKQCQENMLLSATQILAALKAYNLDNKKLPASLDELVPMYLADMPLDPFSEQEFKYDPTKMIIYSVGQDKKDVGGSTGGTWDTMENPTFSVAF
jgi:hypothetical protein